MALLAFEEAKARLLASALTVTDTETLDVADAFGRVLAEDLISPMTVPPFSNAAMDGYAVCAADLTSPGTRLPVTQRIAAGAHVPDGADAVIMQEDCEVDGETVVINQVAPVGQHVRLKGSDLTEGKPLLTRGSRLSAAAMGLVASVGIAEVTVYRRLKVAIFFTGSELVMPGNPLPPGHIYNSNRYVMRGFLQDLGAEVIDLGIIQDQRQATRDALRQAALAADLIVTSGGMSEGDEDHVTAAVKAEGHIDVWKIAAKPGKPLAFGEVAVDGHSAVFIGLPGNPVSVWSGLLTLVAPFLRKSLGLSRIEPDPLTLRADFEYTVKGNRMEFVRVRRNAAGGLDIYPTQDSAIISSAVWSDGVSPVAAGHTVRPGDAIPFMPGPGWTP
jgi:molybdopterin molybdotransferase